MKIRSARAEDAAALTEIAVAAKRHWGYPESWMRNWTQALTMTAEYVEVHSTFVAEVDGVCVGFGAVQRSAAGDAILDHLWVLPVCMGRGVGRALFQHAEAVARASGAARLKIVGDPHAEPFYLHMGATLYGRESATMEGVERFLPLFEKVL